MDIILCSSYAEAWAGLCPPDDSALQPGKTLLAPRRGLPCSTTLPAEPNTLPQLLYISASSPCHQLYSLASRSRTSSAQGDHQDDCGSASVLEILTADYTSNSTKTTSTSSCDSQMDLAALGVGSNAGLSLRPEQRRALFPDDGCSFLRLETADSLHERRHHGGDFAAIALLEDAFRCDCKDAGAPAAPTTYNTFQVVPTTHVPRAQLHLATDAESLSYTSTTTMSLRGVGRHSCSWRLSRLPEKAEVSEQVPPASISARDRRSGSGCMASLRRRCSCGGRATGGETGFTAAAGGAVAALATQGSSSRGMRSVPLGVSPAAAAHGDEAKRRCMASSDPSSLTWPPAPQPGCSHLGATATVSLSLLLPLAATTTSDPPTTTAAAAAFSVDTDRAPSAACTHALSRVPFLDHELSDDSVHNGRPRHSTPTADTQPAGSLLLEWAELESAAATALHRLELTGGPAAALVITFDPSYGARPPVAPPPPLRTATRGSPPLLQLRAPGAAAPWVLLLLACIQWTARLCTRLPVLLRIWVGWRPREAAARVLRGVVACVAARLVGPGAPLAWRCRAVSTARLGGGGRPGGLSSSFDVVKGDGGDDTARRAVLGRSDAATTAAVAACAGDGGVSSQWR